MRHSALVGIVFLQEREILYPFLLLTKSKSSFTEEIYFFFFSFCKQNVSYKTTKWWTKWKVKRIFFNITKSSHCTNAPLKGDFPFCTSVIQMIPTLTQPIYKLGWKFQPKSWILKLGWRAKEKWVGALDWIWAGLACQVACMDSTQDQTKLLRNFLKI